MTSSHAGAFTRAFALHLLLKILSFSTSVVLTRHQTGEMRGLSFALDLYVNSALFISKESIRAANARMGIRSSTDAGNVFALATGSVIIFLFMALPLAFAHASLYQPGELRDVCNPLVVAVAIGGLILDLLSEPFLGVLMASGYYSVKVGVEGIGLVARLLAATACIVGEVSLGASASSPLSVAVTAYSAGLLSGGIVTFALLSATFRIVGARAQSEALAAATRRQLLSLQHPVRLAKRLITTSMDRRALLQELFSESLLRMVLTEGEKAVLSAKGQLSDQGVYDVVSGLSALIVRLFFRMWEDFAFNFWSAPSGDGGSRVSQKKWSLLHVAIRGASYVGCVAMLFGPPLASRLLYLLYGSAWASDTAVAVFRAFMFYLPLLAVNGLLDAFVRATASPATLRKAKALLLGASLVYIVSCYVTLFLFAANVVWLVYVNCANMTLRIALSWVAIRSDYSPVNDPPPLNCLPGIRGLLVLLGALIVRLSFFGNNGGMVHDAILVTVAGAALAGLVIADRDLRPILLRANRYRPM